MAIAERRQKEREWESKARREGGRCSSRAPGGGTWRDEGVRRGAEEPGARRRRRVRCETRPPLARWHAPFRRPWPPLLSRLSALALALAAAAPASSALPSSACFSSFLPSFSSPSFPSSCPSFLFFLTLS